MEFELQGHSFREGTVLSFPGNLFILDGNLKLFTIDGNGERILSLLRQGFLISIYGCI